MTKEKPYLQCPDFAYLCIYAWSKDGAMLFGNFIHPLMRIEINIEFPSGRYSIPDRNRGRYVLSPDNTQMAVIRRFQDDINPTGIYTTTLDGTQQELIYPISETELRRSSVLLWTSGE
jgi:hypothetical protein